MLVRGIFTHKRATETAASYDADTRRRHEYLDSFVHHSVDRMARWLHGVPRGRRIDSLAAGFRHHFPDTPLRSGEKSSVIGTFASRKRLPAGSRAFLFERGLDYPVK